MNQVTNLIQYKNLSDEQKAEFNFEGFKYERQVAYDWEVMPTKFTSPVDDRVYHLVIEPGKYYYIEDKHGFDVRCTDIPINAPILRPAKTSEIPKPEKTLKERVEEEYPDFEVVIFEERHFLGFEGSIPFGGNLGTVEFWPHTTAQSMKRFYKYVYRSKMLTPEDNGFYLGDNPRHLGELPVAALFERPENG